MKVVNNRIMLVKGRALLQLLPIPSCELLKYNGNSLLGKQTTFYEGYCEFLIQPVQFIFTAEWKMSKQADSDASCMLPLRQPHSCDARSDCIILRLGQTFRPTAHPMFSKNILPLIFCCFPGQQGEKFL